MPPHQNMQALPNKRLGVGVNTHDFPEKNQNSNFSARKISSNFTVQEREFSELFPATSEYFLTVLRHFGLNQFTLHHIAFLLLSMYY